MVQGLQQTNIEKINIGQIDTTKKRKYRVLDKHSKNVVQNYNYSNPFNYLKDIAHNLF